MDKDLTNALFPIFEHNLVHAPYQGGGGEKLGLPDKIITVVKSGKKIKFKENFQTNFAMAKSWIISQPPHPPPQLRYK